MSRFARLEIEAREPIRLGDFTVDFGEPESGEVVVTFEPGSVTLHVLGRREIADGALSCSIDGTRRAWATLDAGLVLRLAAELLRRDHGAATEDLRAAIAARRDG